MAQMQQLIHQKSTRNGNKSTIDVYMKVNDRINNIIFTTSNTMSLCPQHLWVQETLDYVTFQQLFVFIYPKRNFI